MLTDQTVLILHLAATAYMTGVIVLVQLLHYPSFGWVDAERYPEFQTMHERQITWVVGPAMLLEIFLAFWIATHTPSGVDPMHAQLGLGLLILIWLSTAFLQVPRHSALAKGYQKAPHRSLVRTNWIRTVAWACRLVIAASMLH